jgi:Raf kinase inhibitor-like YbhB/YbcL family protein
VVITSPGFNANATIPARFTCDGGSSNPELRFSGVPANTKSLALIVFDPDVPKTIKADGRFLHWAMWNLAPQTTVIPERERSGINEGGATGWVPPCPPGGEHRYVFQLFALDTRLRGAAISREADLRRSMEGHVIEQAELVGRYQRPVNAFLGRFAVVVAVLIVVAVVRYMSARRPRRA